MLGKPRTMHVADQDRSAHTAPALGPGREASDAPIVEPTEHFVPGSTAREPHGPLWKVLDAVVLVCVLGMVATVGLQVVSRSLGNAIPWTEELTRFLFLYSAFLGMAAGFRHAEHARIVFVVARMPRNLQRFMVYLYLSAGVVFFAFVAVKGWELTIQQYDSQERSPTMGVGMYLATLPIVVASALAIIGLIQSVYASPRLRQLIERGEMTAS